MPELQPVEAEGRPFAGDAVADRGQGRDHSVLHSIFQRAFPLEVARHARAVTHRLVKLMAVAHRGLAIQRRRQRREALLQTLEMMARRHAHRIRQLRPCPPDIVGRHRARHRHAHGPRPAVGRGEPPFRRRCTGRERFLAARAIDRVRGNDSKRGKGPRGEAVGPAFACGFPLDIIELRRHVMKDDAIGQAALVCFAGRARRGARAARTPARPRQQRWRQAPARGSETGWCGSEATRPRQAGVSPHHGCRPHRPARATGP